MATYFSRRVLVVAREILWRGSGQGTTRFSPLTPDPERLDRLNWAIKQPKLEVWPEELVKIIGWKRLPKPAHIRGQKDSQIVGGVVVATVGGKLLHGRLYQRLLL